MRNAKSEEIKSLAREEGVDFVGVASVDCVETALIRRGPRSALPEACSVVVFAKRMLTGSIESPSKEVVTSQNLALYRELNRISYVRGCSLKQMGFWNLYQSPQVGLHYGCHAYINACTAGASKPG